MKAIKNFNFLIFLVISLLLTNFFVGQGNLWFNSTEWLYGSGDLTNAQLGWQFYQNDIWRFPIGKNPNYGLEISNSIIFTDNIPLLAIIFKILNPFIPYDNFQYFSFWIFACFFLQLFISHKLIEKITNNNIFSIISSILFLLCPFLLFRLSFHFSLGAHWIILYALYLVYFIPDNKKEIHWYFLIFISLMIHLYFTVMIFVIYLSFLLEKILSKNNIKIEIQNLIFKLLFSFIIMYVVGYFESHPINAVSSGYGIFKIDLLSFFDPQIDDHGQQSWSFFLKNLEGTHLEGFTYIGLGNITLLVFPFIIFFKFKSINTSDGCEFKLLRPLNIYLIIFLLWSVTTNISIMGNEIINLKLPKYLFGVLSIFSSTGRFSWPVIYFIIFISIFFLHKSFSKRVSLSLLIIVLFIQIFDVSIGVRDNTFRKTNNKTIKFNDPIWSIIQDNFEIIRTTYLFNNYGPVFTKFSKILGNYKNLKTDIILNAAMDRKKAAQVRYNLIEDVKNQKLINNTAYIIDNVGHLKQLKKQFSHLNYGFFFRDNFWLVLPKKKSLMNVNDLKKLNDVRLDTVELGREYGLKFKGKFLGFGWSHNFEKKGVWSEGNNSFLLFEKPTSKKDLNLELFFTPYKKNKNKNYEVKIYINNKYNQTINLKQKKMAVIKFDNDVKENEILIRFEFDNLVSPYELFESPDARKLGILLKSFILKESI